MKIDGFFKKNKGAVGFVTIGTATIALSLFFEELFKHNIPEIAFKLTGEIGIAITSAGLVGLMLETSHWSHYFSEKLKDIVISKDYVNDLELKQVEVLHENVFAKKYGDCIRDEGSLYKFFKDKTLVELGLPHREDFSLSLGISCNNDILFYEEELFYVCRADKIQGQIQEVINWAYNIDDIQNASITSLTLDFMANDGIYYKYSAFLDEFETHIEGDYCIWSYPIPPGFRRDNLNVTLKASYQGELGRLWGVILYYPMRNIKRLSLKYPLELKHQLVYFGIDEEKLDFISKTDGVYEISYGNWCLQQYGFALQLSRK